MIKYVVPTCIYYGLNPQAIYSMTVAELEVFIEQSQSRESNILQQNAILAYRHACLQASFMRGHDVDIYTFCPELFPETEKSEDDWRIFRHEFEKYVEYHNKKGSDTI